MKKALSLILALVLVLSLGITVFADESGEIKVTYRQRAAAVTMAVDITWGSMEFNYNSGDTKVWNPEKLEYEIVEGGENAAFWTPVNVGGDTVTVTNHSNVGLKVSVAYTPAESNGVTGNMENGTFDVAMPVVGSAYNSAPNGSAKLVLDNTSVPTSWSSEGATTIGSVTVTLESVVIIDATSSTEVELESVLMDVLNNGTTDISVTLAADAGEDMFIAMRNALLNSTSKDGSINLTLTGVKTIPDEAFIDIEEYYDTRTNPAGRKLKSISLPDAEVIGSYSFHGCSYLQSIDLPKAITIESCAFEGCDLRTVVLPEVTTLPMRGFFDNENLTAFSAPKATSLCVNVSTGAWDGCTKLETLELSAAGAQIGQNFLTGVTSENINLTLNSDKKDQVTLNDDGTATWSMTSVEGRALSYTFKSIIFVD